MPTTVSATVLSLDVRPLPDGWTPLEGVAVVKCLDEDGDMALLVRTTAGVTGWEVLGMLDAAAVVQRGAIEEIFVEEDGEE